VNWFGTALGSSVNRVKILNLFGAFGSRGPGTKQGSNFFGSVFFISVFGIFRFGFGSRYFVPRATTKCWCKSVSHRFG
jgi:hypothetical protein